MRLVMSGSRTTIFIDPGQDTISAGGEGTIFHIRSSPTLVAKVFHKPAETRQAKLAAMIQAAPLDPTASMSHVSIAWPTDLLTTERGAFVGFAGKRCRAFKSGSSACQTLSMTSLRP